MNMRTLVLGAMMLAGCGDSRDDLPRTKQTVDGMTIYLGVMAADRLPHPSSSSDGSAGSGGPSVQPVATAKGQGSHHILVALFDAATGTRITDARVRAGVAHRSYGTGSEHLLEPIHTAGMVSYGGFFFMPGEGLWHIQLLIERPGAARPSEAVFAYENAADR